MAIFIFFCQAITLCFLEILLNPKCAADPKRLGNTALFIYMPFTILAITIRKYENLSKVKVIYKVLLTFTPLLCDDLSWIFRTQQLKVNFYYFTSCARKKMGLLEGYPPTDLGANAFSLASSTIFLWFRWCNWLI